MTLVRCAAMALVACGFVATASAQPSETKQFSVPGHGSLVFGVPKGWRAAERPLENPASTALRRAQVLAILADARHSSEAPPPRADALQIRDLAHGYELAVPASRLVMTIPKSAMPRATPEPSPNGHPRYFYFVDGLLNVSGWFEPATEFAGIRSFWERETATWRKKGLPPPVETSFSKIGKWDAVIYDIASPAGTNSHIRAHWVQAGTWIDVHLSVTTDRPSAENRSRLTELLKTIEVREKG